MVGPTARHLSRSLEGRVLGGRYRLGAPLGAGGMGRVYRAVHVELGRRCAVKVIRPPDSNGLGLGWRAAQVRFRVEALAAARLDHPNVLRVLDFGREPEDGLHYLVTEQLEGADLADVLAVEGPLPAGRIARLGRGLAAALQHAHDRGVIHRDLKPENVRLVRLEGDDGGAAEEVKLLDFGAALIAGEDLGAALDGVVLGTPAYMSPEQASGAEIDGRSDLYALGVILFELATGRLPFERATPVSLAAAHAGAAPPAPSELSPSIDPDLEAVILRCLRKRPEERPTEAREVRDALAPVLARADARRLAFEAPLAEPPRTSLVAAARWAALAAGAGALIGLWGWLSTDHGAPAPSGRAQVLTARLSPLVVRLPEARSPAVRPARVQLRDAGADASVGEPR